jgi:hypothetical protein
MPEHVIRAHLRPPHLQQIQNAIAVHVHDDGITDGAEVHAERPAHGNQVLLAVVPSQHPVAQLPVRKLSRQEHVHSAVVVEVRRLNGVLVELPLSGVRMPL